VELAMNNGRPIPTHDLFPSERSFGAPLQQLGYGRLEWVRILSGAIVLDPWPATIRKLGFGCGALGETRNQLAEFELKKRGFREYLRSVADGEIRVLEIHNGLPFAMEIALHPDQFGRHQHA
jgi:hypothetical protein